MEGLKEMIRLVTKFCAVFLISLGTLFFGSGSLAGINPSQSQPDQQDQTVPQSNLSPVNMDVKKDQNQKEASENPYLILVNKDHSLPKENNPEDLVEPQVPFSFSGDNPKRLLRKEAASALEKLFAQADKEKIGIVAVSGYRSFETQQAIYDYNVQVQGQQEADQVSAKPGHSEHQTGLAMDISSPEMGLLLEEEFGDTPEGKWLAKNAPRYGFIIRYPKGKEDITGYSYEPWHIRYVGLKAAHIISEEGLTLEEYVQSFEKVHRKTTVLR